MHPCNQPLIALPSETLGSEELQDIVMEIKECEADNCLLQSQCSDGKMEGDDTSNQLQREHQEQWVLPLAVAVVQ